jgi:hypothetical protein
MGFPAPEVVCASHDVPQSLAEGTAVLLCQTAITVFRAMLLELHSIVSSFKGDVSPRAALPRRRPISIGAKPVKYPSVGQGTCREKGIIT